MSEGAFIQEATLTTEFKALKQNGPEFPKEYKQLKAVVIGGGTGAPVSIRTLLSMGVQTSAVVAMADDGGSTGILRAEAKVTPPGDIRKCLAAFAEDPDDPMTKAFKYRFEFARNHTLGNLMLSALEEATGSFPEAVKICGDLLNCRGYVYPSTLNNVELCARTLDGRTLHGQATACKSKTALEEVWLESAGQPMPYVEAIRAIYEADFVVLGPGSLFTSIIPNLLVPGIPEAIERTKAKTIFVCSLADQQGETWGLSALEHVDALRRHGIGSNLDYVLIHSENELIPRQHIQDSFEAIAGGAALQSAHQESKEGKPLTAHIRPVEISHEDIQLIQRDGTMVLVRNMVDPQRPTWHDPRALAGAFSDVFKLNTEG
ncbi:gluconeogenesis factor YvcK family protein [Anaerotardibacter muris]|uniref:gluconeogenesis factor YvcK family protein n=1 Tax=Anaerotardibacter muris TaxID=2941505 RepID=UPI00203C0738|nr:gluconeogenesis factor YvcK family protein [Anaerotardibacter muris]